VPFGVNFARNDTVWVVDAVRRSRGQYSCHSRSGLREMALFHLSTQ